MIQEDKKWKESYTKSYINYFFYFILLDQKFYWRLIAFIILVLLATNFCIKIVLFWYGKQLSKLFDTANCGKYLIILILLAADA